MLFSSSPQLLSHNGAATIFSNCDCQNIHCGPLLPLRHTPPPPSWGSPAAPQKAGCVVISVIAAVSSRQTWRHATCGPVSRITISGPAASRRHVAVSPCRHVNIADWWPTAHWENFGHQEGIIYCLMFLLSLTHTIIHLQLHFILAILNHIFSDPLHAFRWCSAVAHIWARQPPASRIQI